MAPSNPPVKRSSSSLSDNPTVPDAKRIKRPYHHRHRLHEPVTTNLPEPAIADDAYVDQVMSRIIGQSLHSSGFDIADPLAVESFRDVAEEYLLRLASYVRASMLSSRRLQPIPHDFEYALKRHSLPVDSLVPYLQTPRKVEPIPTQLPSPPPEEDDDFKILPSLEPELDGEDDRARSSYIPKHFPGFPSKHTYRHTPVFTERERDPRKIRERATDDGRHGEEALRKLARAAFKDNQPGSGGREKKQWGRKAETFESMFEKTVKGLAKKASNPPAAGSSNAMDIDSSTAAESEARPGRNKGLAGMELPPIINCERDFWRRNAVSGRQRPEEKSNGTKHTPDISRVESWQSNPNPLGKSASPEISPSKQPHNLPTNHSPRLRNPSLRRITRVLDHFHQLAFIQLDRAAFAPLFLEVPRDDVDVLWEFFGVEHRDEGGHFFGEKLLLEVHEEGLDELLHDLRVLHGANSESPRPGLRITPIDELLELFGRPPQHQYNHPGDEDAAAGDQTDPASAVEYGPTQSEVPAQPAPQSRPHPVLEISSTSSAAGKTQVLYHLCALAVLPAEFNGVLLDGFDSAVVFIDADGRFDAERLRAVARGIVQSTLQNQTGAKDPPNAAIKAMIAESLQHVHVFRPQSSLSLLATLQSLDTYLLNTSRHVSTNRALKAISIDSATAFLWQDKLQEEIARTEDIGRSAAETERSRREKESFHIADLYADLVGALKRLQHIFDCAVIYTATASFFGGRATENQNQNTPAPYGYGYGSYNPHDTALRGPSFRTPLPPPWGLFPTLRLVLQRDVVRPFPPGVTVLEARRNAPMRQEVVMRGKFSGSVNGWGREGWTRTVLEELKRRGGGGFGVRIGREGVFFD
ncbi:uncharacterized protein BDV17DRAFT_282192 [Aspergillus undulatus]|uniref:uncharacterized protein n=1 Tax=Aspergillus undulatus TaxID=1810928 RepID=UPI003CCCB19E